MPSRRRSTTIRRPRVAGLTPAGRRVDDEHVDGSTAAETTAAETAAPERTAPESTAPESTAPESTAPESTAPESTAADSTAPESTAPESTVPDTTAPASGDTEAAAAPESDTAGSGAESTGATQAGGGAPAGAGISRLLTVPVLAGALAVFLGLAVFFGVMDHQLRNSPSGSNTALVDVAATAEVAGQLSDALETVYSYDFARLDENERAAREVITPEFAEQFDALFAEVRELAPQQQAVVTATVTHSAVQSIDGDRAVLVAFMNQQATRTAPGAEAEQLSSAGRITVTGEKVDGRWKIANVEVR